MKNKVIYSLILGVILSTSVIYNSYSAVCFLPDPKQCVGGEVSSSDINDIGYGCGPEYKYTRVIMMGECKRCDIKKSDRYGKYACTCKGGARMNNQGMCECPKDKTWNLSTNRCECASGYVESGNGCVKGYNPETDTCRGYDMDYNSTLSLNKNCWACSACLDPVSMNFRKYKCYIQEKAGYIYVDGQCKVVTPEKDPCKGYTLASKINDNCHSCQECTDSSSANIGKFMCIEKPLPGYEISGNRCVDRCESYSISPDRLQDYGSHCYTCETCTISGSPHNGFAKCKQKAVIDEGYKLEGGKCVANLPEDINIAANISFYYTIGYQDNIHPEIPSASWSKTNNKTLNSNSASRVYVHKVAPSGPVVKELWDNFAIGLHADFLNGSGGEYCSSNGKTVKCPQNIGFAIKTSKGIFDIVDSERVNRGYTYQYSSGYEVTSKPFIFNKTAASSELKPTAKVTFPEASIDSFIIKVDNKKVAEIPVNADLVLPAGETGNKMVLFPNYPSDATKAYTTKIKANGNTYNITISDGMRKAVVDYNEIYNSYREQQLDICCFPTGIPKIIHDYNTEGTKFYGIEDIKINTSDASVDSIDLIFNKDPISQISVSRSQLCTDIPKKTNGIEDIKINTSDASVDSIDRIFNKDPISQINVSGSQLRTDIPKKTTEIGNSYKKVGTYYVKKTVKLPPSGGLQIGLNIPVVIKVISECQNGEILKNVLNPNPCIPRRGGDCLITGIDQIPTEDNSYLNKGM